MSELTPQEREALAEAICVGEGVRWDRVSEHTKATWWRRKAATVEDTVARIVAERTRTPRHKQHMESYGLGYAVGYAAAVERAEVAEREEAQWRDAALKFAEDYHAELDKRIDAEAKVRRVEAVLADEWGTQGPSPLYPEGRRLYRWPANIRDKLRDALSAAERSNHPTEGLEGAETGAEGAERGSEG